jgi:ubiquinone/menaquinone biosynthesis C-methylase UbiE
MKPEITEGKQVAHHATSSAEDLLELVLARVGPCLRAEMTVAVIGSDAEAIAEDLAPLLEQAPATATRTQSLGDVGLDAAIATISLRDAQQQQAAIADLVRVLRPGGRLVLVDAEAGPSQDRQQASALRAMLRAEGLVNVIVDTSSQAAHPSGDTETGALWATGSRRVSGATAAVQANYGALAIEGGCCSSAGQPSCCAPSNAMEFIDAGQPQIVLFDAGYTPDQLGALPAEAANLSLGCGNPAAIAGLRPGETVLDIGSGAGIDAFEAARRVGAGGRVIGLDMTPAMIERANRSAKAAGLAQVEFRLGQAENMPAGDASVDVILSNCVINLAEDKGKVFEEAYRVLKPGGRLSISDMVTSAPLPMNLRSDPRMWADCIHGALPEQEYLDLVRQAGFSDVEGKRSLSSGELSGVQIYSLSVSARKRPD